jgi:hypothetical protein
MMLARLCVLGCLVSSAAGLFSRNAAPASTKKRSLPTLFNSLLEVIGFTQEAEANGEIEARQRMRYWQIATKPMALNDQYLLFDYDAGGLNNIRMGWEYSGVIAQLTGRTLVMPPAHPMYLLDTGDRNKNYLPKEMERKHTVTGMEDLLNMRQLRGSLPVVSAEEFQQRTGLSWEAAKNQAGSLQSKGPSKHHIDDKMLECNNVQEYQSINSKFLYMMTPAGRREGFFCGEWWKRGGPKENLKRHMKDGDWALLQHGFVWHEDAFDIAQRAVNYLGLFDYVAMHARYGDFAEKKSQEGATQLFEHWKKYLPAGSTVYVATDEPDKVKSARPNGVRVVMFDDFFNESTGKLLESTKAKYTPERWFKLIGLVEELICTYSKIFVGTDRSSFTGHIQRMRLHAGAPTTTTINHKDGLTQKVHTPDDFPEVAKEIELWEKNDMKHKFLPLDAGHGSVFLQTTENM